jgi:hypothetical protein
MIEICGMHYYCCKVVPLLVNALRISSKIFSDMTILGYHAQINQVGPKRDHLNV